VAGEVHRYLEDDVLHEGQVLLDQPGKVLLRCLIAHVLIAHVIVLALALPTGNESGRCHDRGFVTTGGDL
jgi:hypothetical protein